MTEEDRPMMYDGGVEGEPFNPHRKDSDCAALGCVPVTPAPDEAQDAAMFRWLVAQSRYAYHCWRLPYFSGDAVSLRAAIASAMAEAMDRLIEDNDE